ncbi:C-type lectin domain family 4 member K-like isoform X3 [Anser cygnoides]|uniref:C-type lectin domain family 4 member K-like isoform X3 n=1 Tax=Anser cygnoides TaxID=8845 RepID=UPI0034D27ACA
MSPMCPHGSHPWVTTGQGWPWGGGQGSPMQGGPVGWPAMGSKPGCGHKPCVEVCPFGTGESLSSLGGGTPSSAVPPRLPPSLSWQFRSLGLPRAGLREEAAVGSASCGMATEGPDLYENLQIRYPHGEQVLDFGSRPSPSRRVQGTLLAVGLAALLALGAALTAVATLRTRDQAELRVARAELEALGPLLPPGPDGRWLQGLGLGWRYHKGKIYYFSGDQKPWREAKEFCLSKQAQLTSVTSRDEQEFLARESRGGYYWIGLEDGDRNDTWRWVDGTVYSPADSFWAPGQPDRQDHGEQGREGCAQIHPVGTGLWNDHNCNIPFLWICKRDLGGP